MRILRKQNKGFTLLEILLVIAAIGILAAIVLVAINPNRQLAQARNVQRRADINTIYKALEQYLIDTGNYPTGITTAVQDICINGNTTNCVNLGVLIPNYIAAIPIDPGGVPYRVAINTSNNRISVFAINAELGQGIGINNRPWTPANISTALWLDAADASTITLNGSTISQWNDKSGNGRNASQTTPANQPTYQTGAINFAANSTQTLLNTNNITGLAGITYYCVVKTESTGDTVNGYAASLISSPNTNNHFFYGNSWYEDWFSANRPFVAGSLQQFANKLVIAKAQQSGTSLIGTINGTVVGSSAETFVSSYLASGYRIGGNPGQRKVNMTFGEVLIVQSPSEDVNKQLEGYLAHKWGLTDKLPANHPYKWDGTLFGGVNITDTDAQTYIAAVEAADGQSLENGVRVAIQDFIVGAKADGIWNAIKSSNILAGARTLNGALIPLKGTAPTNFNFVAGDYNRKTGLVGDGSTKYLDTGRVDNADPQDNAHIAIYVSAAGTKSGYESYIGASNNATSYRHILRVPGNATFAYIRNSSGQRGGTASAVGFLGASRSVGTSFSYRREASTVSISASSVTPSANSIAVFAERNTSTISYSNARLAFYSIGEALDLALLDARVTALVNALAVAIP